jgi:drug/metabolite transporter (DMT)-like permease
LVWGSEWIARPAIDAPPLRALAIRYALAALILALVIGIRRIRLPDRRSLLRAAILGITMLALPAVLTLWAAERIAPGLLVMILAMTPLLAASLEGQAGAWLAPLVGGVGGSALLLAEGLSFGAAQWAGVLATFAAAAVMAGSIVYLKRRLSGISPPVLAAIQFATGFATLGLATLIFEGYSDWLWTRQALAWEIALALLGNVLAFPLYYYLLRRMESFQLASTQWLVTLLSAGEASILLRQRPSWELLGGVALVLASLWSLLTRRSKDDEPLTIRITPPSL